MHMSRHDEPTIKGVFVMSHVNALRRTHGAEALVSLERKLGRSPQFGLTEDVPVSHEVIILEHAIETASEQVLLPEVLALEAGRLHFRNFSHTPLGVLVLPFYSKDFKKLVLNVGEIAESVFQGMLFSGEDAGPHAVRIIMRNSYYPAPHFQGFFEAWMAYGRLIGVVELEDRGGREHAYHISWMP